MFIYNELLIFSALVGIYIFIIRSVRSITFKLLHNLPSIGSLVIHWCYVTYWNYLTCNDAWQNGCIQGIRNLVAERKLSTFRILWILFRSAMDELLHEKELKDIGPVVWIPQQLKSLNINQLDALNFIMSLFHASTCFEHTCSSSGGLSQTCARDGHLY